MSSGNVLERLWKPEASAKQLVLEGKRNPEDFAEVPQKFVFGSVLPDLDWAKVYEILGMATEYAEFAKTHKVEANPDLWVVPVIKGFTCNKVVQALHQLQVEMYLYFYIDNLDKAVLQNDRDPNKGSYLIGFAKNVEADEQNKGKSARKLAEEGHKGITLLERLFLELGYFLATGKHLDIQKLTLCSGSRNSDGDVPGVYWNSDYSKVYVNWYGLDDAYDDLRSRSAVS